MRHFLDERAGISVDRGSGTTEWIGLTAVSVAIALVLTAGGLGAEIRSGVWRELCRLVQMKQCPGPSGPAPTAIPDPDEPSGPCLTDIHSEYGEFTAVGNGRIVNLLSDGGTQLQLRRYVQGGGKPDLWQVWDMSWMDVGGGIGTPKAGRLAFLNGGIWGAAEGSKAEIYHFSGPNGEKEAKDFYRRLEDYRIANPVKVAIRTNPLTGPAHWLAGHLPFGVGEWIGDQIGANEPDRKPSEEFWDGGAFNGFYNDIDLKESPGLRNVRGIDKLPLSIVGKNFGQTSAGVWQDHTSDTTTFYFQLSQQLMESVEVDLREAAKLAGRLAPANAQQRIAQVEKQLSDKVGAMVRLPAPLQRAIATDTGGGIGLRGTVGVWVGLTYKDGKPVGFTQTEDVQGSWHLRGDLDLGPFSSWYQNSQNGARWRTTKTLDLTDPKDLEAFNGYLKQTTPGAQSGGPGDFATRLHQLFVDGNGKMSTVNYDNQVSTFNAAGGFGVVGGEWEHDQTTSTAADAAYWKPGTGWVRWDKCGLG